MTDSPRDEATADLPERQPGEQGPQTPEAWQPPPWARTTAQGPWSGGRSAWTDSGSGQWTQPPASGWDQRRQAWNDPGAPWAHQPAPYGWPAGAGFWPEPGSSPIAVIAGTVLLIAGALMTLFGLILIAVGAGGGAYLDAAAEEAGMPGSGAALGTILVVMAVVVLALGVLQMIAAIGVFTHKEWARWLGIALATLGLLLGLLAVFGSVGQPTADVVSWIILTVWVGGYVAAVAGLAAGGEHFRLPLRGRH